MSILKTAFQTTSLNSDKLQIELLKTGDIFKITSGHNQINLLSGNLIDGQFSNIYLRRKDLDGYQYEKLIGVFSKGGFCLKDNKAYYQGIALGVSYQVIRNILGIKVLDNKLYLDPMLKEAFDQTEVTYHYQGKKLHICYLKGESVSLEINGKKIPMTKQQNQYRNAGFLIDDAFINQQETINITYYF